MKQSSWIYSIFWLVVIVLAVNYSRYNNSQNVSDKVFSEEIKTYEFHLVDSLLVVVDSLKVQVDSLHLATEIDTIILRDSIRTLIDTNKVIENYYKKYTYLISHKDEDVSIKFDFKVKENKMLSPTLKYQILRPTKYSVYQSFSAFYLGGSAGISTSGISSISPELLYVDRNQVFKLGYNIIEGGFNIQLGYYKKL